MPESRLSAVKPRARVAVVGGDTLLGKELRERLEESKPGPRVELIAATTEESTVPGTDDEDTIVLAPLTTESLTGVKVAFLAGSPASSRRALKANPADGPVLIDLTAALEEQPEARLRAPFAESLATRNRAHTSSKIQVIAHPGAIAIAILLKKLTDHAPISRSIINVFEPASERGKKGLDELQQQTVAVLTFQKLKMEVFDAQAGFNLLARYGQESPEPLEDVESRISRHVASLLACNDLDSALDGSVIPMPSLRLIQAPVFHGHSFSVWVEFKEETKTLAPKVLSSWLSDSGIDVYPDDPPSSAKIAGQSGLSAGAISADPNQPRAFWLWMVADNLRLAAENAVAVAQEIL